MHDGDKLRLLDPKADWQREIAMSLWEVSDSLSVERKNRRKSVCDVSPATFVHVHLRTLLILFCSGFTPH